MNGRTQAPGLDSGSETPHFGWRNLLVSPGPLVTLLCWTGDALLTASAAIHFHLWSNGYEHIPTIGPLFLLQTIAGLVVALLVAVSRHFVVALGGALFAAGTIGGLILSVEVGLFGFMDSLSAPYATTSLIVEAAAFVVLLTAALVGLRRRTQTAR